MSDCAGRRNWTRNPWKARTIPDVNSPFMMRYTPISRTASLTTAITIFGIFPRYASSLAYFTCCVFTLASYPDHFLKNPFSAPLDLMVSIISMPERVVE